MAKPKLSAAVRSVGPVATKKEVAQIAQSTGMSVAQVMSKAIDAGVGVGAAAVNAYNKGNLGPASSPLSIMPAQVAQNLAPLSGLQMNPGTVYAGSSTTVTPGTTATKFNGNVSTPATTTYNPIVLPRSVVTGVAASPGAGTGAGAGPYNYAINPGAGNDQGPPPPPGTVNPSNPTGNWWDSITEGINGILTSITDQITANNANQQLYMGDMQQLLSQMNSTGQQTFAPYATTTTFAAPAQGAQTTQAIARRLKNLNTSLAIAPAESTSAGTGLNIPV